MNKDNKYVIAERESDRYLNEIINSQSKKKIVVAGPGTGKTYLFKMLLENKKALTLTFVNSLVDDLSLELCGLSEVRTLHGFALSHLKKSTKKNIKVFPYLPNVIQEDSEFLQGEAIDFESLFNNRDDNNKHIKFYGHRKDYYGEYYGFPDIIFTLVKYLEKGNDKIPTYDLVLIDEFQDFNKLEISLIDLLCKKSPIILVGDDDQALYEVKKNSSTKYIRERFSESDGEYESFSLPYCRRSTRVIVEATNDIINAAIKKGYLKNRIEKKYIYFDNKGKDEISSLNPKIIYCKTVTNAIPSFIEMQLSKVAQLEKSEFSVLIISPYKKHCHLIADALGSRGFLNIDAGKNRSTNEPTLIDGLGILLEKNNSNNNLGWRIVSKSLLSQDKFEELLTLSSKKDAPMIADIIDPAKKKEVKKMLTMLRRFRDKPDSLTDNDFDDILKMVDFNSQDIVKSKLRNEIIPESQWLADRSLKKIHIQISTIISAKGLSADYVFITHFDDRFFIESQKNGNITDKDIYKLIVSLTRAKRKVFLISADRKNEPTLLKLIREDRIQKINYAVNASG